MPILQINFKLNGPAAEYRKVCDSLAHPIANVPGLQWKIWLLNEQEKEAGGIYLFKDDQALDNYLSGPLVAQIKNDPAMKHIHVKRFDVMEEVTTVTRGPIPTLSAAA